MACIKIPVQVNAICIASAKTIIRYAFCQSIWIGTGNNQQSAIMHIRPLCVTGYQCVTQIHQNLTVCSIFIFPSMDFKVQQDSTRETFRMNTPANKITPLDAASVKKRCANDTAFICRSGEDFVT